MQLLEIYKPIKNELGQFEDNFIRQIASQNGFAHILKENLLKVRGKRLRPALVIFSAKMINKKINPSALSLAVAMELIHSASLIHDDVIDGANLRRKAPTLNAKGNNYLAVLMGDYLYSTASIILSDINNQKILGNLSKTTTAMCQSELRQLKGRGNFDLKEDEYLEIIKDKTASLISSCCANAALLAGGSTPQIKGLSDYGLNFGMAFQIVDDCLDFAGEEKALGKTLGLDLKRGSLTLPLIYLINSPQGRKAKALLEIGDLNAVKDLVQKAGVLPQTYQKARRYIDKACLGLKIFDGSPVKASLIELGELCLKRSN